MGIFSNYFEQDDKPRVTNMYEKNYPKSVTIKALENPEFEKDLKEVTDEFNENKKVINETIRHLYSILEDKKFLTYNDLFFTLDELYITNNMKEEAYCFWMGDIEAWKKWIEGKKEHTRLEIAHTEKQMEESNRYLGDLYYEEHGIDHAILMNQNKENN